MEPDEFHVAAMLAAWEQGVICQNTGGSHSPSPDEYELADFFHNVTGHNRTHIREGMRSLVWHKVLKFPHGRGVDSQLPVGVVIPAKSVYTLVYNIADK